MKKKLLIVGMIVLLLLTSGCSGKGTPPVLTVDGIEIIVGESRPYDLTSEGFETSVMGTFLAIGTMPKQSWLSPYLTAEKDGQTFARLYIYNPTNEEKTYGLSTIYQLAFEMNSESAHKWTENNILVNGIDFFGMNSATVKETMAEYKLGIETDLGTLRYDDGDYAYYFTFDQTTGIVTEVEVELQIDKDYSEAK